MEAQARQIRTMLQALGPDYSGLCFYLSSRIDILNAEFCREFALTPDTAVPLPAPKVRWILEQELATRFPGTFREFNYVPFQCTLLDQSHFATLTNGTLVVVALLRPEFYAWLSGAGIPASFNEDSARQVVGPLLTTEVLIDFCRTLKRKIDFSVRSEALASMAEDGPTPHSLNHSIVYRELSTKKVLTTKKQQGLPLIDDTRAHFVSKSTQAHHLCCVWLEQALLGNGFPVDPRAHNVTIVGTNQFLFSGCDLAMLSAATKNNLWNYFMATIADDPDRATTYLLREMLPCKSAKLDVETFRSKFRQAAYFGVLEAVLGTDSNALPQLLFQHWKTMIDHGYEPKPSLLSFYRGLFSIARIAHTLSPQNDPMREGLETLRISRALEQVRDIADWHYWFENSDKFIAAFIAFPQALDEALTRAVSSDQIDPFVNNRDHPRPTGGVPLAGMSAILCTASIILVINRGLSLFIEQVFVILIFLFGLLIIRGLRP